MTNAASPTAEAFAALPDGAYLVDRGRTVTSWNSAAEDISGNSAREVLGHCCGDGLLDHVDDEGRSICGEQCPLLQTMHDGQPRTVRVMLHHREGHPVPVEVRAAPLQDAHGTVVGAVETFRRDVDRFAERAPLDVLDVLDVPDGADPLTALGNCRSLESYLVDRLAALAHHGLPLGVLLCDVDGLTETNDRFGRAAGDRLLQVVADTLVQCLPGPGRAFRYGGDELVGLVSHDDLRTFASRVCAYVAESRIGLPDAVLRVTMSVGATMARPGEDHTDVLRRAARLLRRARNAGGNRAVTDAVVGRR